MSRSIPVSILLLLYSIFSTSQTTSGDITSDETWSGTVVITGNVNIQDGAVVTITPGTMVKFSSGTNLRVYGKLVAEGVAGLPVTFTSNSSSPSPGDWGNIYIDDCDPGTLFYECIIEYGGGGTNGMIYLQNTDFHVQIIYSDIRYSASSGVFVWDNFVPASFLRISYSNIHDNANYGVDVSIYDSYVNIIQTNIFNNGNYGARVWGTWVDMIGVGVQIYDNAYDGLLVRGDILDTPGTEFWYNTNFPYVLEGSVAVAVGTTLALIAGAEVRFTSNTQIEVLGQIYAQGDAANPILFTSAEDSPAPGDWRRIYINNIDSESLFEYCNFSYGGSSEAMMYITGSDDNVVVENCNFEYSAGDAIYIYDNAVPSSTLTISNSSFNNNAGSGIDCLPYPSFLDLTNCSFTNNGDYPLKIFGNQVNNISGSITMTGNAPDGIYLESDDIETTTWPDFNVPYIVGGNMNIPDGNTLTISPGNVIKFENSHQLEVRGTLVADGEPSNRITFTSAESSPAPGDWRRISFTGSDAGCLLDNCDILYAGSTGYAVIVEYTDHTVNISYCNIKYSNGSGLYVNIGNADPLVNIINSSLSNNNDYGITCWPNDVGVQIGSCTLENNGNYPLRIYGNRIKDIGGGLVMSGNLKEGIFVDSDQLETATWPDFGVPYIVGGDLSVPDGETLTLSPGVDLKFDGNRRVQIFGGLVADGDPGNRITISSNEDFPAPGDWKDFFFSNPDPGTIIDHCDIEYGGSGISMINLSAGELSISNSNIRFSESSGIYNSLGDLQISNSSVSNNQAYGITCWSGYSGLVIQDCSIENNGDYPIRMFADQVNNITGTLTISGNNPDAILLDPYTIDNAATWTDLGVPYVINGTQSVSNAILTIEAGTTVKFNQGHQLRILGGLQATGTAIDPVTFTSNQITPAPGDWKFIEFNGTDFPSEMSYCNISYGGSQAGNIYIRNATTMVNLSNINSSESEGAGVYLDDFNNTFSSVLITNSTFENNATYGVTVRNSTGQSFISNTFQNNNSGFYANRGSQNFGGNNKIINNSVYGIELGNDANLNLGTTLSNWTDIYGNGSYNFFNGSTSDVNARFAYWGSTNEASIASGIFDFNDNASFGTVTFNPWTNAAHNQLFPDGGFFVDLTVMLEGPYNSGLMNNALSQLNDFPLSQPYNTSPWNYSGSEAVGVLPAANIVDWVIVELREAANAAGATPATRFDQQAAFLLSDGSVVSLDGNSNLLFPGSVSNNLFAVIWHRNHLAALSANPLSLSANTYSYDFSTGENQVFGGNTGHIQLEPSSWGLFGGDTNGDGSVDITDKTGIWQTSAGTNGYLPGDVNLDGNIDNSDKNELILKNDGETDQVPD